MGTGRGHSLPSLRWMTKDLILSSLLYRSSALLPCLTPFIFPHSCYCGAGVLDSSGTRQVNSRQVKLTTWLPDYLFECGGRLVFVRCLGSEDFVFLFILSFSASLEGFFIFSLFVYCHS